MSKVTLDLSPAQLGLAIDQLPNKAKMKLADRLQDFAARLRINEILRRIDSRKGQRPSTRDILKEIHDHRSRKNA